MPQTQNLEQQNSLPLKEAEFKLKNQKGQALTVKLLLMDQEFVSIQAFFSHSCWSISLNLSQSLKIHNVFFLSNSTEELFSYIEDCFKAKQVSIETVDSLTYLTFNQTLGNIQIEFKITLKQIEMNIQQIIYEMSTEFEEKHIEDQTKIQELQEEIQKLQLNSFSKILKRGEKDMIYKWVSAGKEVSHFELLYKASDHGFQGLAFQLRCDGKGPLVCLVQSQTQRRFGGYIHLKFQKNLNAHVPANPNDSFLFSLDDKKQYLSNEHNSNSYYSATNYGFTMGGGHDLHLADNCNLNSSSYSSIPSSYGKNQGGNNQSLAGSQSFMVNEIEVFQVIYKQ